MTLEELEERYGAEEIELVKRIFDLVVSANHTIFKAEQLSHQNQVWLKEVKNYGNLFVKRLMKIEGHFDLLLESSEDTADLYNDFHDFMAEIHVIKQTEMKEMTEILKACNKDRTMMYGLAKRINES
jgi:predicted DNA-binding ArsR family transcriptional regulator